MSKKSKPYEQRKAIVDELGVLIPSGSKTELYSSTSDILVADLICEGEIEGIVSEEVKLEGEIGHTGYYSATILPYLVQGKKANSQTAELGFLKSIYWNEIPVVDDNGYYNFPEINVKHTKGLPQGETPSLNEDLSIVEGEALKDDMKISLHRQIGERLFGPPIEVGEKSPGYYRSNQGYLSKNEASLWSKTYFSNNESIQETDNEIRTIAGIAGRGTTEDEKFIVGKVTPSTVNQGNNSTINSNSYITDQRATLKGSRLSRNAKTYSIMNRECYRVAVNIKIPVLSEQISDDTTDNIPNDPKSFSTQREGVAARGIQQPYGDNDLRARKVRYQVFYRPIFDGRRGDPSAAAVSSISSVDAILLHLLEVKLIDPNPQVKDGYIVSNSLITILKENGFDYYDENDKVKKKVLMKSDITTNSALKTFFIDFIKQYKDSFPWKMAYEDSIFGRIEQPYIRSRTVNLSDYGIDVWGSDARSDYRLFQGWEIKIVRLTPDSVHTYLRNQSFVDSLTEIYRTKMKYPYCAMVYSKFNAEFFSQAPSRAYDTKLIKVKIPNNYDPIRKTYGISAAFIKNENDTKGEGEKYVSDKNITITNGTKLSYSYENKTYEFVYNGGSVEKGFISQSHDPEYVSTLNTHEANDEDNTIERSKTDPREFWNGDFKEEKFWTDNPAWCFYDLVTNFRYGLGEYIESQFVDKWTLYDISKYCDVLVYNNMGGVEPRFTFNHLIISRTEAYEAVNNFVSAFRGMAYYAFGQIYVVQDKPKEPIYHFNTANVLEGKFNYSSSARKSRHTVALVRYNDKHNMYKPTLSYTEDSEGIRRYGIREIETVSIGCVSESQAKRFGDWMLKSENLETESISFTAGIEATYLRTGDVITVYDKYRNPAKLSGRTLKVSGNEVILDRPIEIKSGITYYLSILLPTFNYDSSVKDLNSKDSQNIRKSHLKTIQISKIDKIKGPFHSDLNEEGEGTVTKVHLVDEIGLEEFSVKENGSYVWSIEPDYESCEIEYTETLLQGYLDYYRIVNITEEETTYQISALQYSYSKYEDSPCLQGELSKKKSIEYRKYSNSLVDVDFSTKK